MARRLLPTVVGVALAASFGALAHAADDEARSEDAGKAPARSAA